MNDVEAIAKRREEWMAAFHAEDIPAMSQYVTEDHLVMPPNRPQLAGLTTAQKFWQEGLSAAKTAMETHSHDVTLLGDTAIDRFMWDQRITLRGGDQTVQDKGKCIWIWRRGRDGAWRVHTAIWNSDLDEPGVWAGG